MRVAILPHLPYYVEVYQIACSSLELCDTHKYDKANFLFAFELCFYTTESKVLLWTPPTNTFTSCPCIFF